MSYSSGFPGADSARSTGGLRTGISKCSRDIRSRTATLSSCCLTIASGMRGQ